jgi:hypothetical protein
LYSEHWVPFLFWLGDKIFDGRLNAGTAARNSRAVRLVANAVQLAILCIVIEEIGFKHFVNCGAEISLDDTEGRTTSAMMGLNMLAVLVGSAANHHKIQQSYDMQVLQQERFNARENTHDEVPHGLNAPAAILWMQFWRYLHDANGLIGTLLSFIIFMDYVDWIETPPHQTGVIFLASRAMALVSVLFAPISTWYRLHVYKNELAKGARSYMNDPGINAAVNQVLCKVKDSREKTLLAYNVYCAYERVKTTNQKISEMQALLAQYLTDDQVDINKIKHFAGPMILDQMDAFHFIELKFEAVLRERPTKTEAIIIDEKPIKEGVNEALLTQAMHSADRTDFDTLKGTVLVKDPVTFQWGFNPDSLKARPHETHLHGQVPALTRILEITGQKK